MFYKKLGNNPFTPNIKIQSILLDNSINVSEDAGTISVTNNDIEIDLQFSSKENFVDAFLSDNEYLSYIKLILMVFDKKENADAVANTFVNSNFINPLDVLIGTSYTYKSVTISLSDYSTIDQVNGNYSGVVESVFRDIDKTSGDIVLLGLPYVDFAEFANQNNINPDYIANALRNIYKNEAHIYTILNNNIVPTESVVSDMRDLTQFKNTLLTFFPTVSSINFDILNSNVTKQQYFFDLYPSFDTENQKIKLYSLFNLKQFVNNFSTINKSYSTDIALTTLNTNPIIINIYKTYVQLDEIVEVGNMQVINNGVRAGTVNAQYYTNIGDNILFSFEDEFPPSTTDINYSFEVIFTDPIFKKYYVNDVNSNCLYNTVIKDFSKLQQTVNINDPRISNAKTGKFENSFINSIRPQDIKFINNFVDNYTELLNLFLDRNDITDEQKTKIKNLLDVRKSTIFVFIDLYSYITSILAQIENMFSNIKSDNIVYNKTFKSVDYNSSLPLFEVNNPISDVIIEQAEPAQSTGKKYFNKLNIINDSAFALDTTKVKQTDTTNYLLKNTLVTQLNSEISFSKEFDLSNNLNESKGLSVKEQTTQFNTKETNGKKAISTKSKTSPNKLLNNSFGNSTAVAFNVPFSTTTFGNTDNKKSLLKSNLNKPIEEAKNSNRLKEEFLFNISQNSNDSTQDLVPETEIQYLTIENNSLTWKIVENKLQGTNFIRTAYKVTNNMFSKNNIEPKVANEYRIEKTVVLQPTNINRRAT